MRAWILAALLAWPIVGEAQTTIVIDPGLEADLVITHRVTDRSKRIYLTAPKSAVVTVLPGNVAAELAALKATLEPPPCDFVLQVGETTVPVPPEALTGKTICLAPGAHPFVLQPPEGLGGFTVRAESFGTAELLGGAVLRRNAIEVEGLVVGQTIWSRKVRP